ncbi:MAG TPA: winged helix-turn-helix domain-containing protein [Nitrososphaera sp.]|nr:winged helix-turn-helix domain-containing protein [Nitrososphaera sp.]
MESPYEKLDTIKRILESTQSSGAQEQGLMYASYLSYMQIDEYLSAMVATGLLRYDRESRMYRITAKGMDFLASLRHMDHLMLTLES